MAKLTEEARLNRNKYLRDWRAKNKEATKRHQVNYWNNLVIRQKEEAEKEEKKSS